MKTLYTKQINRASILNAIEKIIPIIHQYWGEQVIVCHGGVTQLDEDQLKNEKIKTADLIKKIENEENTKPFVVGGWDFFIRNEDKTEMIQLCHESDVHFQSENDKMLREIQAKLNEISIDYHEIKE